MNHHPGDGKGELPWMLQLKRTLVLIAVLFWLVFGAWLDPLFAKSVGIAVVQDGPSWLYDEFFDQVAAELSILVDDTHRVQWLRKPEFNAGWDPGALARSLNQSLADSQVDLVLSVGILTTAAAVDMGTPLPKPVVGGFIPDAAALHLPYSDAGRSTRANLSFVINPQRITDDIRAFLNLIGFSRLHVLVDANLLAGLPGMADRAAGIAERTGLEITLVPIGATAAHTLAVLPPDVEAVYLTPALAMTALERQKLIDGLNTRRVPTFSLLGRPAVETGVLGGLAPGDLTRLARRVALNIQQILIGQEATELPVLLAEEDDLVLSARTAAQIGFSPTIAAWVEVRWIDEPEFDAPLPPLALEVAMRLAARENIRLDIERSRVETAARDHAIAGSRMLPQAQAQGVYQRMDKDRSRASLGLFPWERASVGVTLRQMIFDDAVISAWRATDRLSRAQTLELESRRLDVLAESGQRYLQLLSAQALVRIERRILEMTQTHLRMAQTRRNIGISGPEDVFRWQNEVAQRKQGLFAAQTRVEQAQVALNQMLSVDQDASWDLKEIVLADNEFYFLDNRLAGVMRTVADWNRLQGFFVDLALDMAPELRALDETVAAQEIDRDRLKRRFITPSLHAQLSYDRELADRRADFSVLPLPGTQADKNDWTVGLVLSMPLFEGGGRMHDLRKADARLHGLMQTRQQAAQLIEQRVRSALFALQSSHPAIRLARESARLANQTLQVAQDKYARGAVNILELLDAQNQVFLRDQAAALAVYDYLSDLIECQRSLAWIEADKHAADKEKMLGAIENHIKHATPTDSP